MITLLSHGYSAKEKQEIVGIFRYLEQSVCDYCAYNYDCKYDTYNCPYRHIKKDLIKVTELYKK